MNTALTAATAKRWARALAAALAQGVIARGNMVCGGCAQVPGGASPSQSSTRQGASSQGPRTSAV